MHSPRAQFKSQVNISNEGWTINLLWSVDTQLVRYFSAMHRTLHMHKALVVTVAPPKWAALKKPVMNRTAEDVMCGKFRKAIYLLLRAIFPRLKVL